jgi:hypothetical protein
VTSGEVLEVALAVLAYGLPRATIETIVLACLAVSAPGAKMNSPSGSGVVNHDHIH